MAKYGKLDNPPITEAIIDIQVSLASPTTLEALKKLHEPIKPLYPICKTRVMWQGNFKFDQGQVTRSQMENNPDGYVITSVDQSQILQARLNGFTFSKLKPYKDWESFVDEAKRLWDAYASVVSVSQINRIALRYINKIEVPSSEVDLKEYFQTGPEIAAELPQGLAEYFMRLVIPIPSSDIFVILTQAREPSNSDNLRVILDIDVIRKKDHQYNKSSLWEDFGQLRKIRSDFFFKSITDKTRALF